MDALIRRWHDLIRINSISGHERAAAEFVGAELRNMGLEPHFSYFPEDTDRERPSVWTVFDSGRPGKTMLLIGHIDTVGVSIKNWNTNPFEPVEDGDKVYGRGAMDMKGGISVILSTLQHFVEHPKEVTGRILACFVSDEEGLSKGTYQLVSEGAIAADFALMAECRFKSAAVGFRGRYSFEITVKGAAGHASRYPEVGENALISAGKLAAAIEALPTLTHPKLMHGTWCIRYLTGGVPDALIVPDSCYMFVDRYVVPGETEQICIDQMQEAAKSLGLENKVDIRLKPRNSPYMQSFAIEEDHELVRTLQKNYKEVTGNPLPLAYDPSVCDSNILAVSLGIPVVTFGPSGGNMHGDNEYGFTSQVKESFEIYKKTVRDMLK